MVSLGSSSKFEHGDALLLHKTSRDTEDKRHAARLFLLGQHNAATRTDKNSAHMPETEPTGARPREDLPSPRATEPPTNSKRLMMSGRRNETIKVLDEKAGENSFSVILEDRSL